MAYDSQTLVTRINDLRDESVNDETLKDKYSLKDVSYWKLSEARKKLAKIEDVGSFIEHYSYRPFDFRFVYYHEAVCERLRSEVMFHMRADNIAFLTHRPQSPGDFTFAYCTRMIGDQCVAANKTSGGGNSFQFPLYLYPTSKNNLFDNDESTDAPGGRRSNLAPEFIADFAARLNMSFVADGKGDLAQTFGPEDIFAYMYAVFHSPTYRTRYAEFLKIDFPRLPLTSRPGLFRALCAHGDELVGLHLLEQHAPPITTYPRTGDNNVEAVRYTAPGEAEAGGEGRVWINREQYFEGVPPEVWNFHVGGYQVANKWLKDRKGRQLTFDDLAHYGRVVAALAETIRLMSEIDAIIKEHGDWPMK